jgi:hypothetical protein
MLLWTVRSIKFVVFILGSIVFSETFSSSAVATDKQVLTSAQIEQLVAPIALYPDTLLSEV